MNVIEFIKSINSRSGLVVRTAPLGGEKGELKMSTGVIECGNCGILIGYRGGDSPFTSWCLKCGQAVKDKEKI